MSLFHRPTRDIYSQAVICARHTSAYHQPLPQSATCHGLTWGSAAHRTATLSEMESAAWQLSSSVRLADLCRAIRNARAERRMGLPNRTTGRVRHDLPPNPTDVLRALREGPDSDPRLADVNRLPNRHDRTGWARRWDPERQGDPQASGKLAPLNDAFGDRGSETSVWIRCLKKRMPCGTTTGRGIYSEAAAHAGRRPVSSLVRFAPHHRKQNI
jgi:hypothetical protein